MIISIRDARPGDELGVVCLITELASAGGEASPVSEAFVRDFLASARAHLLLAEVDGKTAGLLSYSVRSDLYHAAPSAMIDEFVVSTPYRGCGIGSAMMSELFARLEAMGCAEVSVTTMPENVAAQRFYRSHGLVDEALFLEKHFVR